MTDETDYFRLADNPEAICSNRNAKWITSAESAFFVPVDWSRLTKQFTPWA
ncbi:MAG TPA: hypothetical protein VIX91_23365 [Candidatus Acidoferrum sp.]